MLVNAIILIITILPPGLMYIDKDPKKSKPIIEAPKFLNQAMFVISASVKLTNQ